jgi:hypothetical protein
MYIKLNEINIDPTDEQLALFMSYVEQSSDDDCWIWTGSKNWMGYGWFGINGGSTPAHRLSYFWSIGMPELPLDHICRNPACVNPGHLEEVTVSENSLRGININAERIKCPMGHYYGGDNLYIDPGGGRRCRACRRLSMGGNEVKSEKSHRNSAKTHCKRGHPLSGDNLQIGNKGQRVCLACRKLAWQAYKERHK